jgi:hypothetical protein
LPEIRLVRLLLLLLDGVKATAAILFAAGPCLPTMHAVLELFCERQCALYFIWAMMERKFEKKHGKETMQLRVAMLTAYTRLTFGMKFACVVALTTYLWPSSIYIKL